VGCGLEIEMTHATIAKRVRERKEKHPELYCPMARCLWRTGGPPCPKHVASAPAGAVLDLGEEESASERARR
jgi:hypothetical protein